MYKVFLVEDEIVIREGIKNIIHWEEEGFKIVGDESDGELAYPMIIREQPDILITDIKMPFMDGLELSKLLKKDIEEINNTVKDVEYFMETGILNDSILEKIGTYEKFQYELSSFSEYLYYDFSSTYDKEIEDVQYAEIEKPEKIVRKRLMNFDYREIMFMIFFLLIFPPLGLYFCYDGFRGKYDDRYTSGLFLGFLGTVLMLFYLWKITDIIFG